MHRPEALQRKSLDVKMMAQIGTVLVSYTAAPKEFHGYFS